MVPNTKRGLELKFLSHKYEKFRYFETAFLSILKYIMDRNINIIAGTTVENKGKLILTAFLCLEKAENAGEAQCNGQPLYFWYCGYDVINWVRLVQ